MQTSRHWYHMIVKTRAEFPLKVSAQCFTQNYCFHESGWFLFPASSPDYLTHAFPLKAFCENFNVTSYYAAGAIVLYTLTFYSFG